MHRIVVSGELPRFEVGASRVRRALATALRKLKARPTSAEVFLVSDATMARLNFRVRRKRGPTTILSFPAGARFPRPDLARGASYRGEIYLAPDCIARRAEDLGALGVHGLLHLMGYTHDGKRDTIEMEQQERRLLASSRLKSQS
jgi:probable rRNA maturation factor